MVKVRIQLKAEAKAGNLSPFFVAKEVYSEAGMKSFYRGLDSALMRQAIYTTTRLGIFFSLTDYIKYNVNDGKNMTFFQKVYSSLTAGGIGSMFGTPADLILVRMQSDQTLPVEQRRNYKNFFDASSRIVAEEGFLSLWKGAPPTIVRAMSLNLGMLVSYQEAKERLEAKMNPFNAWFLASFLSGTIAAFMSLPFDNLKTKLQKMTVGADGKMPYTGIVDCGMKSVANEGVLMLWAGFPTYVFRIAPHVMITFIVSEFLKKKFK